VKIVQPKILVQRGIKVVPKFESSDSILTIKGSISDESELLGIWINKEKLTTSNGNEFSYTFTQGFPDSVLIEAADKYGNYFKEVITATKEKLAENSGESITYYAVIVAIEDYKDKKIESLENPIKDGESLKMSL